ncbi:CHAD domain-containing protein [Pelobacter seleniigenes]|uniref:CHAD domain-containing protein n=1 Tax=Pelobacter seleniigenes TaxID=407188 RepID=UPI0004A71999|nr:CHAD domain-containing protein [Pelobacter seleniigenes]
MKIRSDWQLKEGVSVEDLQQGLTDDLRLCRQESTAREIRVLDDADWQLWQADRLLLREDGTRLKLYDANDNCLAAATAPEKSRFWWELPAGELAEKIRASVPLRAFVAKFQCRISQQPLAVLNPDEKTVVRLRLFGLTRTDGSGLQLLSILPLRGYRQEYDRVVALLLPQLLVKTAPLTLRQLLLQAGMEISALPGKPSFDLDGREPSEEAVTRMAAKLIQLARHQEQGIIEDIDSEFVHQYRVNIRKARSLIALFKKTLSQPRYQALKSELKALGQITNRLRDLDVFLLDQDHYRGLLPDGFQTGLDHLYRRLRRRRAAAFKAVREQLSTEAYLEQISNVLLTLNRPAEFCSAQAQTGIRELVAKKISTQYAAIVRDGSAIDEQTPDSAIHELRIECKKLRYLLELFAELFEKSLLKSLVRQLKELQDNLGRFNDFSVQREFLDRLAGGRGSSDEERASINGLAAVLYNQQVAERGQVVANVNRFIAVPVQESFQQLFHSEGQEPTEP